MLLGVWFIVLGFTVPGALVYHIIIAALCLLPFFVSIRITEIRQKKIWKRFNGTELDRINEQALTAKHIGPLLITQDAVVYLLPGYIMALPIRDIVWAYGRRATWENDLRSDAFSSLCIVLRDKMVYTTLNSNSFGPQIIEDALEFLKINLQEQRPHLLYGYSDELKTMHAKQFHQMVKSADGKR
ncbi:DUF6709 family protein [Oscillospiraceae bacterium MB08-C2-2]|nr:DUF6709 family protein [Oscillospiraceae bacterium MB08-C2-2]